MLVKSTPAGGGACSRSSSSSSSSSRKQRSSNNRSSSRAAYSRSRAAGRPCGHSCQELPRAGNLCFLTRVSEGTLGPVDYHCRAPFRPSVPWCFPVREVRFFKAICWLRDVASSCSSRSRSSAAATTKVAAEQLAAGAGQQEGHVDTVVKSCQELEIFCFLTRPRGLSL